MGGDSVEFVEDDGGEGVVHRGKRRGGIRHGGLNSDWSLLGWSLIIDVCLFFVY